LGYTGVAGIWDHDYRFANGSSDDTMRSTDTRNPTVRHCARWPLIAGPRPPFRTNILRTVLSRFVIVGGTLLSATALPVAAHGGPQPSPLKLGVVRALVISPHPDDATLGAGGLIQRVVREGGTVRVVQMTGGDAFSVGVMTIRHGLRPTAQTYRWYATLREREGVRAMGRLGVPRAQLRFLGFPDEGLCVLASANRSGVFESPYTKRTSPPAAEQVVPGTMYRGDDVIRELRHVIEEFRPTLIVLPHAGDEHPDHCATHRLVHTALADAIADGLRAPRVLHYIVHYPKWLTTKRANAPLTSTSTSDLRSEDWRWRTLGLTAPERVAKRRAIDAFRSQMLVMPEFLRTFEPTGEVFLEGEPSQPVPCWCGSEDIVGSSDRAARNPH
jgi:LmbE family N-acetylglucosaminyl deacetylase